MRRPRTSAQRCAAHALLHSDAPPTHFCTAMRRPRTSAQRCAAHALLHSDALPLHCCTAMRHPTAAQRVACDHIALLDTEQHCVSSKAVGELNDKCAGGWCSVFYVFL
eukprot:Lankesteria_metandrocarpae@DN1022_c0_g1_i3.p1